MPNIAGWYYRFDSESVDNSLKSAIPLDFVPSTPDELARCLADPLWRLGSGFLYRIMVKSDLDGEGTNIKFRPNRAQRRFMARLWHRNIILKARQLGFTSLIAIVWLDHALFNSDQRCGIIAQDIGAAEVIFRDKVKFAYDNLPEQIRSCFPLTKDSATELLFAHNNSSVRVATSMRSGTIHRLHVSEYGKICAKYKDKALEVATGSIPAVPLDGILIIESTAEGQEGDFYDKAQAAIGNHQAGRQLTERDYRFHFFPWFDEPEYRMDGFVPLSDKDHKYFDEIEADTGAKIDLQQRNWYVATRDSDFAGNPERMWQEYPSTAKEAFQVSTEGCFYSEELARARRESRIGFYPMLDGYRVNTFWDIGARDGTGIWFHQRIGGENRFFKYIEGWSQPYSHFITKMAAMRCQWGIHHLPHDAGHERQRMDGVVAPIDELEKADLGGNWEIVPRVGDVVHGIQAMRAVFGQCTFDEVGTKEGIHHLTLYHKQWDARNVCWKQVPDTTDHIHTEAADSIRQFAQGYIPPRAVSTPRRQKSNWKVA